ncbi:MAG: preprotein translocase subunit SecY [Eubacteriales bacterium]|nr:preprotein translocase subunit SecY [Clostridiales bacterium]MDY5016527.1 preprotein translocase subunit SecY [Eubacteriales bacterium]
MFKTFANAWRIPELRKKILFTLLIVAIFRFGSVVLTVPFVDVEQLRLLFDAYTQSGNLLGYFNVLTGGALQNATLFSMSITPYINASIIIQLLTVAIPALERMQKDGGEEGKKKLAAITRYSTVGIGLLQGFTYYIMLKNQSLLTRTDFWSACVIILSFTAGASIVMWLGELITEHGIGNGISDILFVGIVSRIPTMILYMIQYAKQSAGYLIGMIVLVIVALALVVFIVWVSNAERRIPIQYAKRMVGRKMYGGQSTNLPMKVNMSGVLPVIFASTLLMFPATIISFLNPAEGSFWLKVEHFFSPTSWSYVILYTLLIVGFGYFYSLIQFNPVEVANNLKKNGGFVMGYRPGKPTSDYLARILSKITFIGSVFLIIIALLPVILGIVTDINGITIGGTSLLIVVGVALEIYQQLEAQIMMRHYKGFLE